MWGIVRSPHYAPPDIVALCPVRALKFLTGLELYCFGSCPRSIQCSPGFITVISALIRLNWTSCPIRDHQATDFYRDDSMSSLKSCSGPWEWLLTAIEIVIWETNWCLFTLLLWLFSRLLLFLQKVIKRTCLRWFILLGEHRQNGTHKL